MSWHVTARIFWSMAWRTALIGIALGYVAAALLPPSPIGETVRMRAREDLAPYLSMPEYELSFVDAYQTVLRHTQRAVREESILSYAYAYELLRGLVPVTLASFIAACMVLKKRYKTFSLSVTDANGQARSPFGLPAAAFTGFIYAPFFALTVLYYTLPISAVLTSWIVVYLSYLLLCVLGWFAFMRLALRWPYKHFHLHIIPTHTTGAAA